MTYKDDLKRIGIGAADSHPESGEWMFQLFVDARPIGHMMTAERVETVRHWLATALDDLRALFQEEAKRGASSPRK